jgi:ubiquinone/menaquinone biosynthesis C-methylase UbiE
MSTTERYVPAAGRAWLTGLYDPVMALSMRERAFRPALIAAVLAEPHPGTVLDVGCGTGTLAAQLAQADPRVRVLGVDGDRAVLDRARQKTRSFGERVRFSAGLADALTLGDGSVEVAIASLLLHHLGTSAKSRALEETYRVLVPGGRLVIADWGPPRDPLIRLGFLMLQLIDGFASTRDHGAGRLPALIEAAGFGNVHVTQRWRTMWGSLELITASKPA